MKKTRLAAGASIGLLAFLIGVPFAPDQNTAGGTILDIADFICFGAHASATSPAGYGSQDTNGNGAGEEHEHGQPAGLYMPMFSTPPKGGAVYNGPPLDDC